VAAPPPPAAQPAPVFDEEQEFQAVRAMAAQQQWTAARQRMLALAVRPPQPKRFRAYLSYLRGREAQAEGRLRDAEMDFNRALQDNPELPEAKQALAGLRRR
jgi:hypothetical protein